MLALQTRRYADICQSLPSAPIVDTPQRKVQEKQYCEVSNTDLDPS
jgi:hypothetical protein